MRTYYPNYNPVKWSITLDRQVKKSKLYPLIEIDYVSISESELKTIAKINSIRLERLAFTLLCCAKLGNLMNCNNNNWTNREYKELFRLARVTVASRKQCEMLHELKLMGLINTSRKVDNININVNFIDKSSTAALNINDFRELGYEYMLYRGDKYIRCAECNILLKPRSNCQKYCADCRAYTPAKNKIIACVDCGSNVEISALNTKTCRCEPCKILKNKLRQT